MNKIMKIALTLIFIILLSILLTFIKLTLFGTDTIYIADYMPSPDVVKNSSDFPLVALKATFTRGIPLIIIHTIFTIILSIILIKQHILIGTKDFLYPLLIFIVPLIIVLIELYLQFGYSC